MIEPGSVLVNQSEGISGAGGSMRRLPAPLAILADALGCWPWLALAVAELFGVWLPRLPFNAALDSPSRDPSFDRLRKAAIFWMLMAPTLLLWGLSAIQRTERARWRVLSWAAGLCVLGAPFGYGLILCFPLFLCLIVPIIRAFRAEDHVSSP